MGSSKGVHIPGVPIDLPSVSQKDLDDIKFGIEEDVDMIFLSFTRDADTVRHIQDVVLKNGKQTKVNKDTDTKLESLSQLLQWF